MAVFILWGMLSIPHPLEMLPEARYEGCFVIDGARNFRSGCRNGKDFHRKWIKGCGVFPNFPAIKIRTCKQGMGVKYTQASFFHKIIWRNYRSQIPQLTLKKHGGHEWLTWIFQGRIRRKTKCACFPGFLKRFNSNLSADNIMKWWCSKILGDQEHFFSEYT